MELMMVHFIGDTAVNPTLEVWDGSCAGRDVAHICMRQFQELKSNNTTARLFMNAASFSVGKRSH
jgi:hypothetical protein